jgi:sugar phosphate isomerase/epimerase
MLIGSMNNPHNDLFSEVRWIAKNFEFLDLTLEMPKALPQDVNVKAIKTLTKGMPIVGHTGWYLPIGSPFEELRLYAIAEFTKCASVFSRLGVEKMNVHFDTSMPMKKEKHTINFNVWTLSRLVKIGKKYSLDVMVENTPGMFSKSLVLNYVFRKVPDLKFHLDIGHANIGAVNQTPVLIKKFSNRLVHVHISDNNGKSDQHLPLGKGTVKWDTVLKSLKDSGYDGTITLEIFSREAVLKDSVKLRRLWNSL